MPEISTEILQSKIESKIIQQTIYTKIVGGVGAGADNFLKLTDTPASYVGEGGKFVQVNLTEDGLIFTSSTATIAWGGITGTLSDQTDLQLALDGKLSSVVAGTNVTIDDTDPQNPVINASGGGTTNLGYTASPTEGTVTSDTGTDATLPLVDSTNAGLMSPTQNDKLAGIANGAEVNVNADWNAVGGDAEILNKPILATVATSGNHSDLNLDDGTNPHGTTKSDVGLGNVENTALSTWPGSTNITTLGTIGTGTWQGTAIVDAYIASSASWNAKVDGNPAITGDTKTKITYDSKGLVTAGADAGLDDLSDVIIGTPVSDTSATLRILADPNTDGTYTVTDWTPPTGGGGEANTASNVGTDGVGVFDAKVGVDLQFRNIAPASNKITVTLNGEDIDLDITEANLTLSNIGGAVTDAQVPNTITLDNITQITNRSHTDLTDIGTNTHAQIDTHIDDSTIHFTQGAISIPASQISDFDTEVSDNADVAANTSARHAAVTVTDSAEIDFTLTGQNITASLITGSVDKTKLDSSINDSLDLADTSVQPGDNVSDLTNDAGYTSVSSLNDLSDVTIGTPTASTAATLRILADDNTDGTYTVFDWTPPTGGGGSVTSVSAGDGMDFTTITTTGAVVLGTPSTISAASTNSVTTTSHTHQLDVSGISITASQVSDFDTEVSNNSDVSANTSARHSAVTLATSATTGGLSLNTQEIGFQAATTLQNGYLTSTDWDTFNNKQDSLTLGNLTETTSSVLTITGGTGAVIGSGTTIEVDTDLSQYDNSISEFITGLNLNQVGDVTITTPADNELLAYDTTSGEWINQTPTEAGFAAVATSGAYSDLSGAPSLATVATSGDHSDLNLDDGTNPHGTTQADVGLGNVENTALSIWAGSANITTLGTIGTGTWEGDAIDKTYLDSSVVDYTGTPANNQVAVFTNAGTIEGDSNLSWNGSQLDITGRSVFAYSGTSNAFTITNTGTGSSNVGLTVTSTNPDDTTLGISGQETGRGTFKVTHNYTGTSDASASAISILLGGTSAGTAAQGIFLDTTAGQPTTGDLLNLRNDGVDQLTLSSAGVLTTAGNIISGGFFRSNNGLTNNSSGNNSAVKTTTTGTIIDRNVSGSTGVVLQVEQDNAGGTQPLIRALQEATEKFQVDYDGVVRINNTYTLPTTAGSDGQVLTSDGAGGTAWESAGSGSGDVVAGSPVLNTFAIWSNVSSKEITGSELYSDGNNNVGIGKSTMNYKLDVAGNINIDSGNKYKIDGVDLNFSDLAGDVNLSSQVTGTLRVANGGTGQTTYSNGQLLIGNSSGGTLSRAVLTPGDGITITNGFGSITISSANKPAFSAFKGSGFIPTSTSVVIFNNEDYDILGNYNPGNGEFLAPQAGVYHFSFKIGVISTANNMNLFAYLERDGGTGSWSATKVRLQYNFQSSSGADFHLHGSGDLNLLMGEKVRVQARSVNNAANMITGTESVFSGHLI